MDEDLYDYTYFMYDADNETRFDSAEEAQAASDHYASWWAGKKVKGTSRIRQYWVKEVQV